MHVLLALNLWHGTDLATVQGANPRNVNHPKNEKYGSFQFPVVFFPLLANVAGREINPNKEAKAPLIHRDVNPYLFYLYP